MAEHADSAVGLRGQVPVRRPPTAQRHRLERRPGFCDNTSRDDDRKMVCR
jgi:hypothetical protein